MLFLKPISVLRLCRSPISACDNREFSFYFLGYPDASSILACFLPPVSGPVSCHTEYTSFRPIRCPHRTQLLPATLLYAPLVDPRSFLGIQAATKLPYVIDESRPGSPVTAVCRSLPPLAALPLRRSTSVFFLQTGSGLFAFRPLYHQKKPSSPFFLWLFPHTPLQLDSGYSYLLRGFGSSPPSFAPSVLPFIRPLLFQRTTPV